LLATGAGFLDDADSVVKLQEGLAVRERSSYVCVWKARAKFVQSLYEGLRAMLNCRLALQEDSHLEQSTTAQKATTDNYDELLKFLLFAQDVHHSRLDSCWHMGVDVTLRASYDAERDPLADFISAAEGFIRNMYTTQLASMLHNLSSRTAAKILKIVISGGDLATIHKLPLPHIEEDPRSSTTTFGESWYSVGSRVLNHIPDSDTVPAKRVQVQLIAPPDEVPETVEIDGQLALLVGLFEGVWSASVQVAAAVKGCKATKTDEKHDSHFGHGHGFNYVHSACLAVGSRYPFDLARAWPGLGIVHSGVDRFCGCPHD